MYCGIAFKALKQVNNILAEPLLGYVTAAENLYKAGHLLDE
jgi:hypothetical protein